MLERPTSISCWWSEGRPRELRRKTNAFSSNALLGARASRTALSIKKMSTQATLFHFKEPLVSGLSGGLPLALFF